MTLLAESKQQPQQLELFAVRDYVEELMQKDDFGIDLSKYFRQGKFPENNSDKYYFGVEFNNQEHRELITRLKRPIEVLNLYLKIWNQGKFVDLNLFDINQETELIARLFGCGQRDIGVSIVVLKSAVEKIIDAIRNDDRLRKIIMVYDNIVSSVGNDFSVSKKDTKKDKLAFIQGQRGDMRQGVSDNIKIVKTVEEFLSEARQMVVRYVEMLSDDDIQALQEDMTGDRESGGSGDKISKIVRALLQKREIVSKFPGDLSFQGRFDMLNNWLRVAISKRFNDR